MATFSASGTVTLEVPETWIPIDIPDAAPDELVYIAKASEASESRFTVNVVATTTPLDAPVDLDSFEEFVDGSMRENIPAFVLIDRYYVQVNDRHWSRREATLITENDDAVTNVQWTAIAPTTALSITITVANADLLENLPIIESLQQSLRWENAS